MARDEVLLVQKLLEARCQITIRPSHIGKGSGTAGSRRGQFMGEQKRVTRATWIETRISVEEGVSLDGFSI